MTRAFGLHHSFDSDLATELKSVEQAILIHHFQYWIRHNFAMQKNQHDGRTWTYQTIKDIAGHFPYWSHKQVENFLNKLVDKDILIKGNYNKSAYDRTVWYAFKDEARFVIPKQAQIPQGIPEISQNEEMEIPKRVNGNPQTGTPIPDTLPYREEKKKKKRSCAPCIEFNQESQQFENITPQDLDEWQKLYAGVDIQRELAKMRQWLIDPQNPERLGNRTFINSWLNKAHQQAQKPKKATPIPQVNDPDDDKPDIPYNSSIGYSLLHEEGEERYINYLKRVNDPKYYQNFINGIYQSEYVNYLESKESNEE